jgi:hypothetical protein
MARCLIKQKDKLYILHYVCFINVIAGPPQIPNFIKIYYAVSGVEPADG